VEKTKNGSLIAEQTAGALEDIVKGVGKVSDLVAEIAAASSEQARGIVQINQGISLIDAVTQHNTANAEESAAAAEEMSAQAEQLRKMLQRFVLKSGDQARSLRPNLESRIEKCGLDPLFSAKAALPSAPVQIAPGGDEFDTY
jgi:methyl-accepting chemotaxis protein